MKIFVTGIAGFIGFHTAKKLAEHGHEVYGIDNINDYYDVKLKHGRLNELGFSHNEFSVELYECQSNRFRNLRFKKVDLVNKSEIIRIFNKEKFDKVCHLAAQAGVRYSIDNPDAYIESNLVGFANILEAVRHYNVNHLVYASSSSVYGESKTVPFSTDLKIDHPISLYAATKKANELMAHSYSHLYGFSTTGLRFFTVYGPWGRPDMAYYLFTEAIFNEKPIKVFNNGEMFRDFTYIDDIVDGIKKILQNSITTGKAYNIFNIGNNKAEKLNDFISTIENLIGKKAKKEFLPMQPGDVSKTYADIGNLTNEYGFKPTTNIQKGLKEFIAWYVNIGSKI